MAGHITQCIYVVGYVGVLLDWEPPACRVPTLTSTCWENLLVKPGGSFVLILGRGRIPDHKMSVLSQQPMNGQAVPSMPAWRWQSWELTGTDRVRQILLLSHRPDLTESELQDERGTPSRGRPGWGKLASGLRLPSTWEMD